MYVVIAVPITESKKQVLQQLNYKYNAIIKKTTTSHRVIVISQYEL